jgi:hypothetical protein
MSTPSAQGVSRLPSLSTVRGMVRRDAECYADRDASAELYRALTSRQFCYVFTPRPMGKSSLVVRTSVRLKEKGTGVLVLDLTPSGMYLTAELPASPNLSGQCGASRRRCRTGRVGSCTARPGLASGPSRMKCPKSIRITCIASFTSLSRTS